MRDAEVALLAAETCAGKKVYGLAGGGEVWDGRFERLECLEMNGFLLNVEGLKVCLGFLPFEFHGGSIRTPGWLLRPVLKGFYMG